MFQITYIYWEILDPVSTKANTKARQSKGTLKPRIPLPRPNGSSGPAALFYMHLLDLMDGVKVTGVNLDSPVYPADFHFD